jgi:two-component system cell cycle sensor histidine kinase/response regulator CckA
VVDDERPLLEVVGAFIEEFGDRPLTANSVAEARQAFAAHPEIACVLVDLTMPSGGGAALARAFKEQRPAVPVVLMSGFAHADVTKGLGPILDAVIAKPFSPSDLQRTLDRALGR